MTSRRRAAAGLAAFLAMAFPTGATADTFTVTRTDDPDASAGACAGGGPCSLRQAVNAANATQGTDLVTLPPGTFVRNRALGAGKITISGPLTIAGAGARASVIDATADRQGQTQGLTLIGAGAIELRDLSVIGAHGSLDGGGIQSGPSVALTLRRVAVTGNRVLTGPYPSEQSKGGGISAAGDLTLIDSTVAGNRAEGTTSAVVGTGGGIYAAGSLSMVNSTVTGNFAHAGGGIYLNDAVATLTHVTLAANSAGDDGLGGNLILVGQRVGATLQGTIVSGGSGLAPIRDCYGGARVTSLGGNVGTGIGCALGPADRIVDPGLGPLADNGGPTETMALPPASPAVDALACAIGTDQRGLVRPAGPACDAGAFELGAAAPVPVTVTAGVPNAAVPSVAKPVTSAASSRPRGQALPVGCRLRPAGHAGRLKVAVRCTRAVIATLRGSLLVGGRRVAVKPVRSRFAAKRWKTLRLRVPSVAGKAIARGTTAKVSLELKGSAGRLGAATLPGLRATPTRPSRP